MSTRTKTRSRTVHISLPEGLLRRVDELARKENRSRSELFREAVRRYLEEKTLFPPSERRAWAGLADSALRRLWDNPEDAIYDAWEPDNTVNPTPRAQAKAGKKKDKTP